MSGDNPTFIPTHEPATGTDDNWKHRSQTMGCNTCMWYVPKLPTKPTPTLIGRCRRYAPSHVSIGWPVVFPGDWCGEHKLDEEKT